MIYSLQMSTKEKIGVIIAMSLGCLYATRIIYIIIASTNPVPSAGITAAVKTSFLPGIGKFSEPTYELADLLIWSNAEVAVTIMAASIPFFRVLLRQVRSSYSGRSKKPYRQSYRLESYGGAMGNGTLGRKGIKEIPKVRGPDGDDLSERSILGDGIIVGSGGHGNIVKSSEVTIEYSEERKT